MKRSVFEKHLKKNNCHLLREGRSHSIFINMETREKSPVPRHNEINNWTIQKICKDLNIQKPY